MGWGRWSDEACDQLKATDLDTWVQGERFAIHMYVTGSDDSGTDTAEEDSSTDTASESEAFHWIESPKTGITESTFYGLRLKIYHVVYTAILNCMLNIKRLAQVVL